MSLEEPEAKNEIGRWAEALDSFQAALKIAEHRQRELGETPETLEDLGRALLKLTEAQVSGADPRMSLSRAVSSALPRYLRSLELRERVVKQFGNTADALRAIGVSLVKVADTEFDLGNWHSAFARYSRAIELHQSVIAEYGATPESLGELGRLLEGAGSIRRFGGDLVGALTSFMASLDVREQLVKQVGGTFNALKERASILERIGDTQRSLGNVTASASSFLECLECREIILREFGDSTESLRALSDIEWRLSQVLPEEACPHLEQGRAALQSILDHGWGDSATTAQIARFDREMRSRHCSPAKFRL